MGKTSSWFISLFKRAFASSGRRPVEEKHAKKWELGKSKQDDGSDSCSAVRRQQLRSAMERFMLEDVQSEKEQQPKPRIAPDYARVAAIKIQTGYRGYKARRNYRTLKGLMRLQRAIRNDGVKRQTTNALRCMQMLVRLQLRIRDRRLKMAEKRGLQLRQASIAAAPQTGAAEWEGSVLAGEELEARMRRKVEAFIGRERALAYACACQAAAPPKSAEGIAMPTSRAPWRIEVAPPPQRHAAARRRPHRRHYARLMKSEYADDESLMSCPASVVEANYMATTASAQSKARRSHRSFGEMPGCPKTKKRFSFGLGQTIGALFAGKEASMGGCTGAGAGAGDCGGAKSVRTQGSHRSTQSVGGMSLNSSISLPNKSSVGGRNHK